MADTTFTWIRPPKALESDVRTWGRRMLDALFELAGFWAARFETYAKAHASWTDRTAHARAGLTAKAVRAGSIVFIYLFHTMAYGIWLEIAFAGKYAILVPTILTHLSEVIASMKRLGAK